MQSLRARLLLPVFAFAALVGAAAPAAAPDKRPNVVIILADDVALMDFGIYGGEARTPNIDALAGRGALFTQYRASPLCSPSRAMLLTGMDAHLTGIATIPEVLPKSQRGQPGYAMALEPGVLTLADRLRAAGYSTVMAGKWHLGEEPDEMPQAHGFDRSFALVASGADNWDDRSYMPYYKDAPWFEDGAEAGLPEDFYSSRFIVDKAIAYLGETDPAKPFFAYLPFQAIHIPVQAPQEFIDRYRGRYDQGWEALRKERHQRSQALGLIPQGTPLAALPPDFRPWDSLSPDDRALYAARMEVNAAMLEAMDFHIGRLIQHLKAKGEFDNTIFIVSSDNGPEPSRGDDSATLGLFHRLTGYDIKAAPMGGPGSWGFIGPEWAAAAATPGAWFKFYATEGGIRVPLIMAGPGIAPQRINSPAMVTDIAPTVLDWLAVDPGATPGKPMTGRSLLPVLGGKVESVYGADEARAVEVSGNSALYLGDYKITRSVPPVGDGQWRLYNLARDPGETTDLSAREPDIKQRLLAEYAAYAARVGVLEMPKGYDSMAQVTRNIGARLLSNYPWLYGVLGGILVVIVAAIWLAQRQLRGLLRRRRAAQ
jgi:arylsulfatase A-like enzyme